MTTQHIVESEMEFGPYPKDRCFYIEKSECYSAVRDHVKMAEFLLLRVTDENSALWVIEAKSSTPRAETKPNFDSFIAEIREKLTNAFSLGWASCLGRHPQAKAELPKDFKTLDLSRADVVFCLVIRGHKEEWLPPLKDALENELRSTVKTWAFSGNSVVVINDSLARENGLILTPTGGDA